LVGSGSGETIGHTIGNILSAQFYAAALQAHPDISKEIAAGEFSTLHAWLREHLYQHGRMFKPQELVERTTYGPMSTKPYIAYIHSKYGELYQLPVW
jgi:carboxypeptidase Taq